MYSYICYRKRLLLRYLAIPKNKFLLKALAETRVNNGMKRQNRQLFLPIYSIFNDG